MCSRRHGPYSVMYVTIIILFRVTPLTFIAVFYFSNCHARLCIVLAYSKEQFVFNPYIAESAELWPKYDTYVSMYPKVDGTCMHTIHYSMSIGHLAIITVYCISIGSCHAIDSV